MSFYTEGYTCYIHIKNKVLGYIDCLLNVFLLLFYPLKYLPNIHWVLQWPVITGRAKELFFLPSQMKCKGS